MPSFHLSHAHLRWQSFVKTFGLLFNPVSKIRQWQVVRTAAVLLPLDSANDSNRARHASSRCMYVDTYTPSPSSQSKEG